MATTTSTAPLRRGAFLWVWAGQVVSTMGSGLSGFALGLWVFQRTGQVTPFALITLMSVLPGLLLAPITGVVVDRVNRRKVMVLADLGAALCTVALWGLFRSGEPRLGWIALMVALSSTCSALQGPAYAAATAQLVDRGSLGRVNGLVNLGTAASEILTPALAGALMLTIGVPGILLIDLVSFLFAVGTLAFVRIPDVSAPESGTWSALRSSIRADARAGWRYLVSRKGLVALVAFMAMVNFVWGMVRTLIAPLILGFGDSATLGLLISIAGAGLLSGSLILTAWGGPKRKVFGVLAFELLSGVAFAIIGAAPVWQVVAFGVFLAHLTVAMVQGCGRTIWQTAVPEEMQGRVMSLQGAVSRVTVPVAVLLAGPLADRVFEPAMVDGGALAISVGGVIGVGPGRGVALMFLLMAVVKIAVSAWGLTWRGLREVDG